MLKALKALLHYSYKVMLVMISKGEIQTPNWVGCANVNTWIIELGESKASYSG